MLKQRFEKEMYDLEAMDEKCENSNAKEDAVMASNSGQLELTGNINLTLKIG